MTLAEYVKQKRKALGMSQRQLAAAAGLSNTAVSRIEAGIRRPGGDTLKKLARALGCPVHEMLALAGLTDPSPEPEDENSGVVRLPILGEVRAGAPLLAEQHIEGWQSIPRDWLKPGARYFLLRVKGDSMAPTIPDGSLALVRVQPEVENRKIAVVMTDEDNATLKRVSRTGGGILLRPDNPKYEEVLLYPSRVRIIGKVEKCITSEEE